MSGYHRLMRYAGTFTVVILCVLGCQSRKQSIERVLQSDVECKVVIQAEWGSGIGELGYLSDDQSHSTPLKPFRYAHVLLLILAMASTPIGFSLSL